MIRFLIPIISHFSIILWSFFDSSLDVNHQSFLIPVFNVPVMVASFDCSQSSRPKRAHYLVFSFLVVNFDQLKLVVFDVSLDVSFSMSI